MKQLLEGGIDARRDLLRGVTSFDEQIAIFAGGSGAGRSIKRKHWRWGASDDCGSDSGDQTAETWSSGAATETDAPA